MANKILKIILVVDLVVVNGLLVYLSFKPQATIPKSQLSSNIQVPSTQTVYQDTCGNDCRNYIDARIGGLSVAPTALPTPTPKVVAKTASKAKVRTVQYIAVPGSGGNTLNMDWTDVGGSDFYFNKADYPGLIEVYFESNMRLAGSGMAYVRLFDVNDGIGVQGSDVQTSSNTDGVVVSGKVNFWNGNNVIRVQVKSLTTEQAIFNSGRIRVVSEN